MADPDSNLYRRLQRHLDDQAVGFPEASNGADLRLLKTLFSPEEASLALSLGYSPKSSRELVSEPGLPGSNESYEELLDAMFMKGLIGRREREGEARWQLIPLVVGMFEAVGQDPPPRKLGAMLSYMRTEEWNRALRGTKPSQMRTIPIGKSVKVERLVARYEDERAILRESMGPFAVIPCICREHAAKAGKPCAVASQKESCLGLGDAADMMLRQGRGRRIEREEALAILARNEADGLVLQPANAKDPEFICSCCGCCCGMLGYLKSMERPLEHWTAAYQARVDPGLCTACGLCESRCQIGAIAVDPAASAWRADEDRCIGCGLCVPTCPSEAIALVKREQAREPPESAESLYETIRANRMRGGA